MSPLRSLDSLRRARSASARSGDSSLDRALGDVRNAFWALFGFSFFVNLLMFASPLYMMQVYDRVLGSGHVETLVLLTVMVAVALIFLGALDAVRGLFLASINAWLERRLGGDLIQASLSSTLAGVTTGAQPLRDLAQVRNFFGSPAILPFFDAPWSPLFILMAWVLHPWIGILTLICAMILFALAVTNELATRSALEAANRGTVAAQTQVDGLLRNAEVVQAMGMAPVLIGRWTALSEEALTHQDRAAHRMQLIQGVSKAVRLFAQSAALGLSAYLVLKGEVSGGAMIASSILLGRALAPVEQALGGWKAMRGALTCLRRLRTHVAAHPLPVPPMPLPAPTGMIEVDRLIYTPPGSGGPVLKLVSFKAQPGEAICILGPSGAGKSTLCRLLLGIYAPTGGHVRIDGADVHLWDRAALGRHIGYLPQDVELFAGTILDNIARMGTPDPEQAVAAAKLAGVHEMILQLPAGYDTPIQPASGLLSAGQRQRLGLARALYGDPVLIVLDEPNSNLDPEGELALIAAIQAMKERRRTVLLVAHRPTVLRCVDHILLLRNGAVEEFGPRDQLLARLTKPHTVPPKAAGAVSMGGVAIVGAGGEA